MASLVPPTCFNVLISSLSKKVPLIREIRKALERIDPEATVFGADSDASCIGQYFVDTFWHMPELSDLDPDEVIRFCHTNEIRAIIPTRDGELIFFAWHRARFAAAGVAVMIAPVDAVRACVDKLSFFQALKDLPGVCTIPAADHPDDRQARRWVVKERYGAGSNNLRLDLTAAEARDAVSDFENPIFQPFIEGVEYSIDVYVDRSAAPKGCIVRTRDVVLQGESQVTTTTDRQGIADACLAAAGHLGLTGHMVFQAIEDDRGDVHLIECNSRFGGASTLAIAAGLDSFYWFFRECLGNDLHDVAFVESPEGLRQVRYAADKIFTVPPINQQRGHRAHRE
jgi:carbamoyl-phosphate synthase large subunit